jgi:hypothetical protein
MMKNRQGYNTWRDGETPTEILTQLCALHKIEPLEIKDCEARIGRFVIKMEQGTSKEQLAMEVLKNWKTIGGWQLVPEHVESRPLFNPKKPGVEQVRTVEYFILNLFLNCTFDRAACKCGLTCSLLQVPYQGPKSTSLQEPLRIMNFE